VENIGIEKIDDFHRFLYVRSEVAYDEDIAGRVLTISAPSERKGLIILEPLSQECISTEEFE